MKNLLKLLGVVLIAAFMMISVSCREKGGTIEVYNSLSTTTWVTVVKGSKDLSESLQEGQGDEIAPGASKSWDFDEDGTYFVGAIPPIGFYKLAVLLGGNTEKITIKDKK